MNSTGTAGRNLRLIPENGVPAGLLSQLCGIALLAAVICVVLLLRKQFQTNVLEDGKQQAAAWNQAEVARREAENQALEKALERGRRIINAEDVAKDWHEAIRKRGAIQPQEMKRRVVQARNDVKSLDRALCAYYLGNKKYPQTLEDLCRPLKDEDGSLLPELQRQDLIDPWGQPYLYDPANRHPNTGRPRIYSKGPPGDNQPISNW